MRFDEFSVLLDISVSFFFLKKGWKCIRFYDRKKLDFAKKENLISKKYHVRKYRAFEIRILTFLIFSKRKLNKR